jgi:hypothetical protein
MTRAFGRCASFKGAPCQALLVPIRNKRLTVVLWSVGAGGGAAMAEVESQLFASAASAAVASSQKRAIGYRLGQRVQHKTAKWQGLVCGFDAACTEGDEWIAAASAAAPFTDGTNQPFYQVRCARGIDRGTSGLGPLRLLFTLRHHDDSDSVLLLEHSLSPLSQL